MRHRKNQSKGFRPWVSFLSITLGALYLILTPGPAAHGAVTVDDVSTGTTIGGNTITISHTTSSPPDRLMLVGVSMNNGDYETVTGITYGGVPLTLVGTQAQDDDARIEVWSLVGPPTGSQNVVITFSAALEKEAIAGVITLLGVDQTTPLGPFASAADSLSTPATVDILAEADDLVFGVAAAEDKALTSSSGQTEHWNISLSGVRTDGAGGTVTGPGPLVTMSWDLTSEDHWAMGGVAIKPADAVPPDPCGDTFSYRKKITIDSSKVSGVSDLIDLPVLVRLTGTDFQEIEDNARPDGYDIVFRASDGTTQLAHEIELYDVTNDELIAWVKVPNLSPTVDTEIYLYYGSTCITSPTETPNAVWDSHFKGVWHLAEDPSVPTAPQIMDSTANNNHGTALDNSWNEWTSADLVVGKIGPGLKCHDTGGSQKHIDLGNNSSLDVPTAMTLEAWVNNDTVELLNRYIFYKNSAYMLSPMRGYNNTPNVYVYINGSGWDARHSYDGETCTAGEWNYLVGTYNSADQTLRIYIDGVEKRTKTLSGLTDYTINASTEILRLNKYVEGIIDEGRISDIARSADWIKTCYNNQNDPSTFYTVTPEEVLDPDAPSIMITSPTSGSTWPSEVDSVTIAGVASGTNGIVEVTWSNAGTGGSGFCTGTDTWSATVSLVEGDNLITVIATDSLGKTASDLLAVEYAPPTPDPDPDPDPESNPDPDAPGDTEIFSNNLEPNVIILLDSSGSMNTAVYLDEYDPTIDYTTPLLSQGKSIVFARSSSGCHGDHQRVFFNTSDGKARLKYKAATSGDICSGTDYATRLSEGDGYFYFRRDTGEFISKMDYSSSNPNHIKIWLPYAEESVDPSGEADHTWYIYNYLNWLFYHSTQEERDELEAQHWIPEQRALLKRISVAKKAIVDLVASTPAVRYGIFKFNGANGAELLAAVPSDTTAVENNLKGVVADGSTPLAEALEDIWDYYTGATGEFTLNPWCRRNFAIVVTDGVPTSDADQLSAYIKKDWDGDNGGTEANGWTGDELNLELGSSSDYLDDVAYYIRHNDAWTDEDNYPGIQNVTTYTIGFTLHHALLEDAATNGGGEYYTCQDLKGLQAALQSVVQEIIEITYSYSAPVVPVNRMERTTSGSSIYLALFKPTLNAFWKGNIKKFGIATSDVGAIKTGDILDKTGVRATDDLGYIYETAVSYWNDIEDGGDAEMGGVGEVLLNRTTTRNIYTWLDKDNLSLTHNNNAFTQANTWLTRQRLGAADDDEKNDIIDFIHGKDVCDEDGDSDTDEKRSWILGDFLHSRPCVVSYDDNTTVVFAGANDGMLHAFWDGDTGVHPGGTELWAYIPPSLLTKLKYLQGSSHSYYVDGSPDLYLIDNNNDGDIKESDGDQAILMCGLRRGGRAYFALDVTDPHNPKIPSGWAKWGMWLSTAVWRPSGMIGAEMSLTAGEKAEATFPYSEMGQSWSMPVFGKINYDGTPKEVAFIGAGYSTNQDQASPSWADEDMGRGIYMVDPLTGDRVWRYTKWSEWDFEMDWSIPSEIAAIDTTDNGYIDRLYVGDMGGQLWRVDIGNPDHTKWDNNTKIIFDANKSGGVRRKIFYAPDVTLEDGYEMLFFGTGDRAHPKCGDPINRIYALKDTNPGSILGEGDLVDVTEDYLQDAGWGGDKVALRNQILTGDGWYIRLVDNLGEKVLAPALVYGGIVYITTFTPAAVDDPCTFQEGAARLYALDYRTGEAALNYDTTTEGLTKSDRTMIIGNAIPSRVVVALIDGKPEAYIGIRGGIVNPNIGGANPLISIYWRQVLQ